MLSLFAGIHSAFLGISRHAGQANVPLLYAMQGVFSIFGMPGKCPILPSDADRMPSDAGRVPRNGEYIFKALMT